MFASGLKETVVWLSNALSAFAISENLFICWRVRFLRPQDDQWRMFGKRRNTLISASLGSTATTVTPSSLQPKDKTHASHKFLPATLNLMYMKKSYTKSSTVIEQSLDFFLLKLEAIKNVWGVRKRKKKSSKRECTWTTTDNHKQSDYWNHFWKPHPSFKLVSFRGRALSLVSPAQRFCGLMSKTRLGRVVDLLNDLSGNLMGHDDRLKSQLFTRPEQDNRFNSDAWFWTLYSFARFIQSPRLCSKTQLPTGNTLRPLKIPSFGQNLKLHCMYSLWQAQ